MIRLHPLVLVPATLLGFGVAWLTLPAAKPDKTLSPVMIGDMRAIVTALDPYEQGHSWDRPSVCVRGKLRSEYSQERGTVGIEFHPRPETKLYGWGDDIPSAISDLNAGSDIVKNVLTQFMKVNP